MGIQSIGQNCLIWLKEFQLDFAVSLWHKAGKSKYRAYIKCYDNLNDWTKPIYGYYHNIHHQASWLGISSSMAWPPKPSLHFTLLLALRYTDWARRMFNQSLMLLQPLTSTIFSKTTHLNLLDPSPFIFLPPLMGHLASPWPFPY